MNTQLSEVYEFNSISVTLPNQDALRNLALSDSGFVFDPINGNSFTVNSCGLSVLRSLKDGRSFHEILELLRQEYRVDSRLAERDVLDFIAQLRKQYK